MIPHIHATIIKAWADGHKIQCIPEYCNYWADVDNPYWSPMLKYRIKPEEKKKIKLWKALIKYTVNNTYSDSMNYYPSLKAAQKQYENIAHSIVIQLLPHTEIEIEE